jgi:hypothetical protein
MCHYQTLYYHESIGYVIRCVQCDKIQLSFGNFVIGLEPVEFTHFCEWIAHVKAGQQPAENPMLKTLMIPTPCEGLQLFLSYRELGELHEMLETADTELKSSELLKLFS